MNPLLQKNEGMSPKKKICTQGGATKKNRKILEGAAKLASLLAKEKRGERKLINDAHPTTACNREKGERQVETEDQ